MNWIRTLTIVALFFCASYLQAADSCITTVLGVHVNDAQLDKYGFLADFNGMTTHTLCWDWLNPDSSLSDSRQTCQPPINVAGGVLTCNAGLDGCVLGSSGIDWSNNNSCPTITGCDGVDDDLLLTAADRMVVAVYVTSTSAPYTSKFLVDSVNYDLLNARYSFNDSTSGAVRHELFTMVRPTIFTATQGAGSVTVTLQITEPIFNAAGTTGGLYGNSGLADDMLAGYKIVAVQSAAAPANGLASNYSISIGDVDRFIPASRPPNGATLTSNQITVPTSGGDPLWIAWVPIFNFSTSGCSSDACSQAEVQALDSGASGLGSNSLSARMASAASAGLAVTSVTFVSFTGSWKRAHNVDLAWTTATETNTAGFNLYRSQDGTNWTKVNNQLIVAKGQGGAGASYTYGHHFPKTKRVKTWQYKLDAVDLNNNVSESMIIVVQRKLGK